MSAADPPVPPIRIEDWGDEKQLVASADVVTGALLLAEYPIAFAHIRPEEDEQAPWLLLETILATESMFVRVLAEDLKLTKWSLSREDEESIDRLARKYNRNPKKLTHLYHRVAANNIRYGTDGVTGNGIWPWLSRSNHSCDPNSQVRGAKGRPLAELLVATRPIPAGTPVTWNYFSGSTFLDLDWFGRNARLQQQYRFVCRCPRCEAERPAHLKGLSKDQIVARYFAQ